MRNHSFGSAAAFTIYALVSKFKMIQRRIEKSLEELLELSAGSDCPESRLFKI
jgi:hypothetical protein